MARAVHYRMSHFKTIAPLYQSIKNWLEKLNHFYGWQCNLGVEAIQITMDGILTGNCIQPLYEGDQHYNILDPEFSEKFKPIIKPTICKQLTCTCTTDIHFNKHKI